MCGIAGAVGVDSGRERGAVERMVDALAHRGPDDRGVWAGEDAVLGNRRLQVIDLAGGHQPLSNDDGSLWITYNGEVYNYVELRAELEARGHRFRTRTDTEVVLRLYESEGPACLPRLRGMFAFAIWDVRRRRLFAARDRFGQKPFFYHASGRTLRFASEVKSLLAHPSITAEPEIAAIDYYLALRLVPPPLTLFHGISKLPSGHWLSWEDGTTDVECWWEPSFLEVEQRTEREWIEGLNAAVADAVAVHMRSDVEVGAFLSGGIDSSVVTAYMSRSSPQPVRTYAVGSDVPGYDERPFARLVARHCGTVHTESVATAAQFDRIPELVRQLDEPSDPIAACFDAAARLASRDVKVVLGGDGGDEMFAGFDRYAAFRAVRWYASLPAWIREDLLAPTARALRHGFGYKELAERARWLVEVGAEGDSGRSYARMTSYFRFGEAEKRDLYGEELRDRLAGADAAEAIAEPFRRAPAGNVLHRMIFADLVTRLPEHTLMLSDRLAMAHGLELRAPLLDDRLFDFCARMPARMKVRGRATKYAIRRAARPLLPTSILRRAKQGFMFPVAHWLDAETAGRLASKLERGPLVRSGWIRAEAVSRLVEEHLRHRADHHVRLWMLLNLDAWHAIYLDGAEPERLGLTPRPPRAGSPGSGARSGPS